DSATKGSAGRLTVGVPLRTRRAEALAFLRRLIHLLGGDQYRSFDTGLAGPVPGKRDGCGACGIGEIYYRENIGITESKIQRLQFASGRFEELLGCLPPLGAAVFCHTFRAVLRQRNLHKKFRHINLLVMEPITKLLLMSSAEVTRFSGRNYLPGNPCPRTIITSLFVA